MDGAGDQRRLSAWAEASSAMRDGSVWLQTGRETRRREAGEANAGQLKGSPNGGEGSWAVSPQRVSSCVRVWVWVSARPSLNVAVQAETHL